MDKSSGLTCIICNDTLKNPKQLPCSHSCCRSCLQNYCLNNADTMLRCPLCGAVVTPTNPDIPLVQWIDNFPVDTKAVEKLANMAWLDEATAKEKCATCLKKHKALTATKYCKTCDVFFCDNCGNNHWLSLASKSHRVMLIEELEDFKNDPFLRANLASVFSARIKCGSARSRQRSASLRSNSARQERLSVGGGQGSDLLTPGNVSPGNSPSSPKPRKGSGNLLSPPSPRLTLPASADVDVNVCRITAVTFLSDGCVVISDEGNQKLKLFDKNYRFLSSIDGFCWNLVNTNNMSFAGTCPQEKCLKHFIVDDAVIKEGNVVELGQTCYGLCKFGNRVAAACSEDKIKVKILNDQKVLKSFLLGKGELNLSKPSNLCYQNANGRKLFYVSDFETSCLKCFTETGDIVWERTLSNMRGFAIYGTSLIVGRGSQHTVDILTMEGRCLKSIVGTEDNLSDVAYIAVEESVSLDDRLIVTDESELVRVFTLVDPSADHTSACHKWNQSENETKRTTKKSKLCYIL